MVQVGNVERIVTVKPLYKDTLGTGIYILIKGVSLYPGARDRVNKGGKKKGGGLKNLITLKKAM